MELEEEEGQVCRLCGQCENIFIDVFGEEGTKRLLGVKIQTKVNILIDERDPLPKTICVQCLGKLEFVCDFQEECLRTQQVLHDRYNLPPLGDLEKSIESTGVPTTRLETTAATATAPDGSTTAMATATAVSSSPNPGPTESVEEQPEYRVLRNSKNSSQRVTRSSRARQEPAISAPPPPPPAPTPSTALLPNTDGDLPIFRVTENGERLDPIIDGTSSSSSSSSSSLSSSGSPEFSCSSSERDLNANVVQIPTLALNKLLTMVSNSPNIDISVKESTNRSGNVEDISFTVELCKKEPATEEGAGAVVRARVFPDQGSCLVDTTIVGLLEKQSSVLVNSIINSIAAAGGSGGKDGADGVAKFDELEFLEERLNGTQNPEELFRVDGEEIRVDENVEPAMLDQQSGYACKLCKKFYERKDKCTVHVKTHLGIKQYACTLCTARFVCKSDVMKHIRCSHTNPRPIQCPKCPKRFRSKFYLTEHDNVHKGVRPYRCSDCGQSYHHKVSLQIHAKSHLPPQNLACEYCGKVFPFRTRLLSHVGSVHMKNRRNFRCRFCYNLYSSLAVLNEHIKTRHATTYTCDICGKTFKVASKYKAHVSQHTNPKPYVCNVCNNRYASKAFLNEHLLKHEGLRKHKCQKCGASFAQASHLAAHRHVHGEKTHACPECGRMFNRRDNMKVHRKRHFEQQAKKAPGAGSAAAVGGEQSKGLVAKDDPETKGLLGLQASNENEK